MAQAGSPASPLKKNLVSRCVNQVGLDRAIQYSRDGRDKSRSLGVPGHPVKAG
jgi:hypothetical protein